MKLRLKGNSIRIRLDRRDLASLIERGRVEDALSFGPAVGFSYAVETGDAPAGRPTAVYAPDRLTIRIARADAAEWAASDRVGFSHEQPVEGGVVRVLLEKDFACLERPAGEESDDAFAFPNPNTSC